MCARFLLLVTLFLTASLTGWAQGGGKNVPYLIVDTAKVEPSRFVNQRLRHIASSTDTGGVTTVFETTELPGYKTQWHRHNNSEESFYILEGVLTIKMGGKTHHVGPGSYVFIPRGTEHGQGNFGDKPVRFLTIITPGGFEAFFRERDEKLKNLKPGDPEFEKRFNEVRAKYKHWMEALGPWQPDK